MPTFKPFFGLLRIRFHCGKTTHFWLSCFSSVSPSSTGTQVLKPSPEMVSLVGQKTIGKSSQKSFFSSGNSAKCVVKTIWLYRISGKFYINNATHFVILSKKCVWRRAYVVFLENACAPLPSFPRILLRGHFSRLLGVEISSPIFSWFGFFFFLIFTTHFKYHFRFEDSIQFTESSIT